MFDNTGEEKKQQENKEKKKDITKRAFHLNKNVSAESLQGIIQGILHVNKHDKEQEEKDPDYQREPITLVVDSFGGSIYDGFALMGVIDTSVTPVHGYCYSKAMSMGFAIYIVCHQRFAHPLAYFMYHDGATSLGDKIEGIQQSIDQSKRIVATSDSYITSYTDLTQEELDEVKTFKKDWYMSAQEARDLGIVDEILKSTRQNHRK